MAELGEVTRALLDIARTLRAERDLARRICWACIDGLDVDGAAISLLTAGNLRETLYASDATAEALEDLQFGLGEGACVDAATSGRAVLVADVGEPVQTRRWPVYAAAVVERTSARAVFAFPLQWGAINLGVLDLYRRTPGPLAGDQLRDAISAADAATLMLLGMRSDPDPDATGAWERSWTGRAQIHQATGMIVAQLGVSPADAFARLRAHAFGRGTTLEEVAADVVARRLRLDGNELDGDDT